MVADTPTADLILGRVFLQNHGCIIVMGTKANDLDVLHVKSQGLKVPILKDPNPSLFPVLWVVLQEQVKVPPLSELEVMGRVSATAINKMWMVQEKSQGHSGVNSNTTVHSSAKQQ